MSTDKASEAEKLYKPTMTQTGKVINVHFNNAPVFTLTDLFAMLPKGIIHNGLSCRLRITSWYDEPWFAGYENQVSRYIMCNPYDAPFCADELIDVIFQLLCWAIDHNHVKLD